MSYLLNGMKYNWIVFIYLTDVNTKNSHMARNLESL